MKQKILLFLIGGGTSVLVYLLLLSIYTRNSSDPIIFFASIVIAIIIMISTSCIFYQIKYRSKKIFDKFTCFVIGVTYCLTILVFSVFGPTFIDRSISYHIAFLATEEKQIKIEDIEKEFSDEIFEKRIHDAVVTGFIVENENGSFEPTWKSKIITKILKPIGFITGSLNEYEKLKIELQKEKEQ